MRLTGPDNSKDPKKQAAPEPRDAPVVPAGGAILPPRAAASPSGLEAFLPPPPMTAEQQQAMAALQPIPSLEESALPHPPMLSREEITQALERLAHRLGEAGIHGAELRIVGGAALVLAHSLRGATKDVDAHLHPQQESRRIAQAVGDELHLPGGWLNDAFKLYLPVKQDFTKEGMPQFQDLTVFRPSDAMLFAMKAAACRIEEEVENPEESTDVKDLYALAGLLNLRNMDEVRDLVHAYYPPPGPILVPTRFWYLMDAYFSPNSP